MYMFFENEHGRIDFGFGTSGEINITELEGFGLVPKEYSTVRYIEYDGEYTQSHTTGARTMTVAGDIKLSNNLRLTQILNILNFPGYLQVGFGSKHRKIFCSRICFTEGARNSRYMRFVIQFTADMPYFEDIRKHSVNVYHTLKLISSPFSFPKQLSTRVNSLNILNNGETELEPIFYIINIAKSSIESSGLGIEIKNETTNKRIMLLTETERGEIITIDLPNRKITSNLNGNKLNCISNDTFLSNFRLAIGNNNIAVTNYNSNEQVAVACEYSKKYIDALY